ncbi:protein kinase c-binding protein nell2, partial [Plakobranchus ocellatus]
MCCESAAGHRRSHHNNACPVPSYATAAVISAAPGASSSSTTSFTSSPNFCSPSTNTSRRTSRSATTTIAAAAAAVRLLGLSLMLLLCCSQGLAIEPARRDVLDLMRGLQDTSADQLTGLRFTQGPTNGTSALLLQETPRRIALPSSVKDRALAVLAGHQEITFLCTLRQDVDTSGTLLALTTETRRFLEIESSGRRKELRFHFSHMNQPRTETFPYMLADGKWHRLAVYLSGDSVSIYVDCQRIYKRVIPTPDRVWRGTAAAGGDNSNDSLHLFLGQRNSHHALFRGALQDVKIVTQAHGYLLQCPDSDTDCPTCAQFQALEQQLHQMSSMYRDLNNKLSRAEVRITDLEQCDCLQTCNDNGTIRKQGERWKTDLCHSCFCMNGEAKCHREECPYLNCKNPVQLEGKCCPVCASKCFYQGKHYDHGEEMVPRVCVTCRCKLGSMVCETMNTTLECPKLNCPKSEQIAIHNQCCPVCDGTDYCSMGHTCHVNATCINLKTKFACQCNKGFVGDGHTCNDIDECQTVKGSHGHHCSLSSTRCVNTLGGYRCACLNGHTRVDQFECKGTKRADSSKSSAPRSAHLVPQSRRHNHDECLEGTHHCNAEAHCVNVGGSYKCMCKDGYTGDGYTCTPHCMAGCRNGGKCIRPNVCECRHGYIGPSCDL